MLTTFSSDQPISSSSEDLLGRSSFASRLADTISNREDESSIAIGLYGAWGDGKTSVLRMMKEYLREHEDIIVIDFNPWIFKSEESLLSNFFLNLADKLGSKLSTKKEDIGAILKKYGGVISISGFNAEKLGESLSTTELEELKQRVEKILCDNHKKVVILIDDIDRLDRDETYAIFKLVRLTASFNHTSYVLAFDHDIVSSALGERYAQGGKFAGEAFLEKIIQVPLYLPPADAKNLRQITLQGVDSALNQAGISLTPKQVEFFVYCFDAGIAPKLNTPRLSRLYYNALLFSLPLLKGEVNPVDQMLIEGIRISYPGLYRQIKKTPHVFLSGMPYDGILEKKNSEDCRKFAKKLLAECLPESTNLEHQEILDKLLPNIFPALLGGGINKAADVQKKISSPNYFWKYFMYSVPSDDLSDVQLEIFLEKISKDGGADSINWFNELCSKGKSINFIRKLVDRLPTMDEDSSYCLLGFIISNLHKLDTAYKPFSWFSDTRSMTENLIADLLDKIGTVANQEELVMRLVQDATPLGLVAITFFRRIRNDNRKKTRILTEEVEERALHALATRILDIDQTTPLYIQETDIPRLCYKIVGDTLGYKTLSERLKSRFDLSPEDVDLFLVSLAGQVWVAGSHEPECGDLDDDNYQQITQMIDPQYIANNLTTRFGEALNQGIDIFEPIDPKLKVAIQFVGRYRAAIPEESQDPIN